MATVTAAAPVDTGPADGPLPGNNAATAQGAGALPAADVSCAAAAAAAVPFKDDAGWRRIVRNFTPSWFSVNMGTGIVSILLYNLPYNVAWVQYMAIAIFCLNVGLFSAFFSITAIRYVLYPEIWGVMIKHPVQSLFLGCIPMGFATIVNMTVFVCASWGSWVVYLAWSMWWLDVVVACACSLIIPFIMVRHHHNQLSNMTAALLLPVVPVVVASASGGIVAEVLPNPSHAITTLIASYVLWGLGQAFSWMILATYFLRLQLHDLPPREVIVSVFLPIGPLGQGGFAIQQLGKVALQLLPATGGFLVSPAAATTTTTTTTSGADAGAFVSAGMVFYILGIMAALVMWGAALGWLAFALSSILSIKSFPFNMGWWGFTFPLGVFTTCTGLMATELSSKFLRILTMVFSFCVFGLWILVATKTLIMAVTGDMFYAPCLKDLRPKERQSGQDRTV